MQLLVTRGPDIGKRLLLYPGQTYNIGRDPAYCQLSLKDPAASRIHTKIELDDKNRVIVTDNHSQNGTSVNGMPISAPVVINPGSYMTICSNIIELQMATSHHRKELDAAYTAHLSAVNKQVFSSSPGTIITIGRDPSNTLVLQHPHVSRHHAIIETTNQGTYIRDLNSTNGVYIDGVRITNKQAIFSDSVIRISGFRLTMKDFQVVKHDENAGQVEITVRDFSKVVVMPNGEQRVLLNNLNFRIEPREFVAILGGSGTGKSTLLKAMMGTWPANFGELLVNGTNYYEEYGAFKSMIGYVPQDDIVHMDLSVEEVLNYAARLRMPDDTSPQERSLRVEQVLQSLGLTERRTLLVKNLSGGQRKRVSIGVELITKPSIMFLDEPTSGLDPGLEKVMMEMLRNMANQGQTIILVTHATFNISLCDKLIFLTEGGCLAFFGTPKEALAYFGTDDFAEIYKMIKVDKSPQDWQYRYSVSTYAAKYRPHGSSKASAGIFVDASSTRRSSLKQCYNLTDRYIRTVIRDTKNLVVLLLQPVIIASLLCLVFLNAAPAFEQSAFLPEDVLVTETAIMEGRLEEINQNIVSETSRQRNMTFLVLAAVISAIWSGASNSIREVVKEISIYKRERFVNIRITPYLMSKTIVLAIICIIQAFIFVSIVSLILGFPNYWLHVLAFYLIAFASALMGLAISAFASNANMATSILPITLIPQFILAGAVVPIDSVKPEFLQVIFHFILGRWSFELLGGGVCDINSLLAFDKPIKALDGSFTMHWWIIAGFCLVFYCLSAIAMLKKDNDLS